MMIVCVVGRRPGSGGGATSGMGAGAGMGCATGANGSTQGVSCGGA
ncbi:MAG: hypothetical protein HQL38_18820, partial [Alphaproteobacteria bacterium]|nr:hypothetical protein [Alphaproteobacteria bacterium]